VVSLDVDNRDGRSASGAQRGAEIQANPIRGQEDAIRPLNIEYLDGMDASERYEQLIAFLNTHLPTPVQQEELSDGSLMFTGGSPGEVVARLTKVSVIIEQYAVRWETPYTPVMRPRRVGVVKWRR